jgi:hypothetical protein
MATKPTPKKVVVKQLMKTPTRKVEEVKIIKSKPLDTSVPTKKDMIRKVNTKMVENAYDSGILRRNMGGQANPTPYPNVSSKKPTIVQKVVSKLKKKK